MPTDDIAHGPEAPPGATPPDPAELSPVAVDPDVGRQMLCDSCGARLTLDVDAVVATAQIITFVAAHAGGGRSMAIRLHIR